MDISAIIKASPDAIVKGVAERLKARRLEKDLTQKAFAARAGVGYDAYRKFESTGDITLRNLVRCAMVLDETARFDDLFTTRQYTSLDALIEQTAANKKKRGRRND